MVAALAAATGCSSSSENQNEEGNIARHSNEFEMIYFGYDSHGLSEDAKVSLRENARILKDKPTTKIQIQGHCDERGSIQYNLALGEKRASEVRAFLISLGVSDQQISIISMGEEAPAVTGSSETDYAQNRRAEFVITSETAMVK